MKYGEDFWTCSVMFERGSGLVSDIIEDIEIIGSPSISAGIIPSHTWLVTDETTGIEASTEGIAYFPLTKYFNDPSCTVVSCRLIGLDTDTVHQMLALADKLAKEGLSYDYEGLIGDALEALTGLDNLIPTLRDIANPLHTSHRLFCSALVSTIVSATPRYHDQPLFKAYTISKISPLLLYTGLPYDFSRIIKGVNGA